MKNAEIKLIFLSDSLHVRFNAEVTLKTFNQKKQ